MLNLRVGAAANWKITVYIYICVCIYIYIAMELLYYIRMDRLAMNSHGDNPGCTAILLRLGLRRELPFRL